MKGIGLDKAAVLESQIVGEHCHGRPLFYNLNVDSLTYSVNTAVNILTTLINNQDTTTQLLLTLTVINQETGSIIYTVTKEEELSAFGSKTLTQTFDTALNLAGYYTLTQTLTGTSVSMSREIYFYIRPSRLITIAIEAQLQQVTANTPTDLQLTLNLKNSGNVNIENEPVNIEIFDKKIGEVINNAILKYDSLGLKTFVLSFTY